MKPIVYINLALLALARLASAAPSIGTPAPVSGIDLQYVDASVRPQDDLYQHLNGRWLDSFQIPPDRGRYGAFNEIDDNTQQQLKGIVEGLPVLPAAGDEEVRKIADLYASFMNETLLDVLGAYPLEPDFKRIDALKSKDGLPALIAEFNRIGADAPLGMDVEQDARDSTRYAVAVGQGGLGLPDRDYYLKDDARFKSARAKYVAHMSRMLGLVSDRNAAKDAQSILALETSIARIQWTRVENRDPVKTYNKTALTALPKLMAGFDWSRYTADAAFADKVDYVIVNQPSYFKKLGTLTARTPLPVWKAYFKWHLLSAAAPYLSKPFVDEEFAFRGTALRDIPQNLPRWKRGIGLIDGALGEALGKLYVQQYFPPANKARMDALVRNLIAAYSADIKTLDWMGPETKKGAQEKLDKLVTKIGYPDKWRDYSALVIKRDDLYGNVERSQRFEYQRNINKLGKPIDRTEWAMTPQTVNAYYNPLMNEIVFPAAILQPPFFNVLADDAVNYGGIGGVIGHEISHGFDDQGSQFDANGNLRDWFTQEDHQRFAAKTKALVAQYARYEPVPGIHVNGELTLGENIADNSGLAIAYKAYLISLGGKPAPVIDGLTGEQRLYLGWVQVWRGKVRENQAVLYLKSDPHSPEAVRGEAPVRNQAGFYAAFDVQPGDKMYLPPDQRVTIW
jgi:predicted metalloendopeptidase